MVLAIVVGSSTYADRATFRVAIEDVPGSTQLEEGEIKKGIAILEAAYAEGRVADVEALATLCGAYFLDRALAKAKSTCNEAIKNHSSKSSWNNYGIYLAIEGDLEGAIRIFKKVQPLALDEYLEFLRSKDVGLMALQNEVVAQSYLQGKVATSDESDRRLAQIEVFPE